VKLEACTRRSARTHLSEPRRARPSPMEGMVPPTGLEPVTSSLRRLVTLRKKKCLTGDLGASRCLLRPLPNLVPSGRVANLSVFLAKALSAIVRALGDLLQPQGEADSERRYGWKADIRLPTCGSQPRGRSTTQPALTRGPMPTRTRIFQQPPLSRRPELYWRRLSGGDLGQKGGVSPLWVERGRSRLTAVTGPRNRQDEVRLRKQPVVQVSRQRRQSAGAPCSFHFETQNHLGWAV